MARVPVAEERVVFSGANFAQTRQTGGGASPLVNFLHDWAARRAGEIHEEARRRVAGMAIQQQRELGAEGIAETPEGVRGPFADEFQHQAQAVFAASFARDLQIKTRELAEQFSDDPEGFAEAYNAFMVPQLEPLEEANPVVAERLRQEMDAVGLEVMFGLQDNLAAAAEAEARFQALNSYSEFVVEVMDELNASGDESSLARHMSQADEVLEGLREAGYLTTEQFLRQRQDFRNSAATEQAFGAFRQAVERGDIAGAQAIIDRTERGVLFDDNPAGRAAASQLNTRLQAALRGAEEASANLHTRAMRSIRNWQDLAELGEPVSFDDPAIQNAFEVAFLHANTDGQIDAVRRARADVALSVALGPVLQEAPVSTILEVRQQITQSADVLPAGRVKTALEAIDARLEAIDEADFTGDTARLFNVRPNASPEERNRARERVANQIGAPPEMVPHYSFDEVWRFQREFDAAMDREDSAGALRFVEQFYSVVPNDPTSRIALAQQYGQSGFSAIASIAELAGGNNAAILFELARQGEGAGATEVAKAQRGRSGRKLDRIAEAAALGHPDIENQIHSILTNALVALEETQGRSGRAEFDRLVGDMESTIELANGAVVPSQLFAPGVGDRATRREINALLKQPEAFGVVPGDTNTMETLRPRPLPDGGLVWFSTRAPNALVGDPETGGVLISDLEARVAPVRDAQAESRGFFERANDLFNRSSQLTSYGGFTTTAAPLAATATGTSFGDLTAIRMTSADTPTQSHAGRDGVMLLGADTLRSLDSAEYRAAWQQLRQAAREARAGAFPADPPSPRSSIEGAAVAAGLILRRFRDKYDSEEQALAAYWIGEQAMDALGDQWRGLLPQEADQFVARVMRHRRRLEGGE